MKVLVVGKGGREHALAKALAESAGTDQVYAIPGSRGMEPEVVACGGSESFEDVYQVYQEKGIELVVVGPEGPLVDGLADRLREKGVLVFGPDQKGARLEGSKIFCKEFMEKYSVPTSQFRIVTSSQQVMQEASHFTPPYVLKADGLAGGKGVFICQNLEELSSAATDLFDKKILGVAGERALLEQFQPGYELSFFILTNGEGFEPLPMAQDHKRLGDNDQGPNTGGMGTVAPMKVSPEDYQEIIEKVVKPTVVGLKEEGFVYRGVVFIGLMMTDSGPQVLEYNIRFGDPETQVLLPLLDGHWSEAFLAIARGELPSLKWKDEYATCVVLAAEGYPSQPKKDVEIRGDFKSNKHQYFLHAGTDYRDGQWLVHGGRVLNAIGIAGSLEESIKRAYEQSEKVSWKGCQKRNDIGQKAAR